MPAPVPACDRTQDCGFSAEIGAWSVGPIAESDWGPSVWIEANSSTPAPTDCDWYSDTPAPLFRRLFSLPQGAVVQRAVLHIAALGYFTAFVDGVVVSDAALDPPWTNVSAYVLYSSFDVTSALASSTAGAHVVGVAMGNGWYNPAPLKMWGTYEIRNTLYVRVRPRVRASVPPCLRASVPPCLPYPPCHSHGSWCCSAHGSPKFRGLLVVALSDGSTFRVASDSSWLVGPSGLLRNSVYLGVKMDARLEPDGWNTAAFQPPPSWHAVSTTVPGIVAGIGQLVARAVPGVVVQRQWQAVGPQYPGDSSIVYDVSQNIAGVVNVTVVGPAGATLVARYGELLYANGSVNAMTSVAGQIKSGNGGPCAPAIAFQEDTFILRGGATESFTSPFVWHGFRYIAFWWTFVPAGGAAPAIVSVSAHQLFTDFERVSTFTSSSALLNAVFDMALESQMSNLANSGVQSDCPHR